MGVVWFGNVLYMMLCGAHDAYDDREAKERALLMYVIFAIAIGAGVVLGWWFRPALKLAIIAPCIFLIVVLVFLRVTEEID